MTNPIKISAVIITFNEEDNIERCIKSLKDVADEIIVVDSYSTDKTKDLCVGLDVVFLENKFAGHIEQKNFAMKQAKNEFVLSLDADEALTKELKESILDAKSNCEFDSYTFNRLTNYCGHWVKHCGWYPDKKLRLWNSAKGQWSGTNPHDHVVMDSNSTSSHLKGDLLHYSYASISQHINQINFFSDIASKAYFEKGKKSSLFLILFAPVFKFFKSYFFQLGILDGYSGLVISVISAHEKFLKYVKLRMKYQQ